MSNNQDNQFVRWLFDGALFVGIVGVFLLFVYYGLNLIYPAPDYDDFCGDGRSVVPSEQISPEQCADIGGKWQTQNASQIRPPAKTTATNTALSSATGTQVAGFCDRDFTCRNNYEAAQTNHSRIAFGILSFLGLLVATTGLRRSYRSILGASLSAAGILLVLVSAVRYWANIEGWLQFALLFFALMVFSYFGYQKDQDG